jgi:hypothetical protein
VPVGKTLHRSTNSVYIKTNKTDRQISPGDIREWHEDRDIDYPIVFYKFKAKNAQNQNKVFVF